MIVNFVIIVGRIGPGTAGTESGLFFGPSDEMSYRSRSLTGSLISTMGGVDRFVESGHRIRLHGSVYPESDITAPPWIRTLSSERLRAYKDEAQSIARCGRPICDAEICCSLTHRSVFKELAKNIRESGDWDPHPQVFPEYDTPILYEGDPFAKELDRREELFVVLEADAIPLPNLSYIIEYGREMQASEAHCSLLHGGAALQRRLELAPPSPRPLMGVKRYGTYSMAFTGRGVFSACEILHRDDKILVPVDDLFMASGRFAVPSIPMFEHDYSKESSIAPERSQLQERMNRGEFKTDHGQINSIRTNLRHRGHRR